MPPTDPAGPSTRRVVSQAVVPRDITARFTSAAAKLQTGQLVKDEYFSLFDSVGALEIMDSKMDSGYLGPGENNAKALEDDYDVMRELTPEEVLGVMDELLAQEIAWHMGHPLSQTLFTSIYVDHLLWPVPKAMEELRFGRDKSTQQDADGKMVHLVLRAYCLALIKACDFVQARVAAEYYFEEEDFVTQLYNRSLLTQFDEEHFQELINEAVVWVDQQDINDELKEAIKCRLIFRRDFLGGVAQDIEIIQTRSMQPFESCLEQLPLLTKSVSLGKPVPDSFSSKIQRKLASTLPPRPMVKVSAEDAVAHVKRICQDAIDLKEILDYRGSHNLKVAIWTLLSRKPQPSVYIRCLVQSIIVNGMVVLGAVPVREFLYDELAELVLPSSLLLQANTDETEVPSDPRFQVAEHMNMFVQRFAQPFVDTIRCACINRCRVRRTICHTVLDWDNLQFEAEELDVQLRLLNGEPPLTLQNGDPTYSYPLSSWCYHQKLCQLRSIIQLGFELSIYSPEELPGMYWYLNHICSTHLSHLDRIRTFILTSSKRNLASSLLPGKKQEAIEQQTALQRSLRLLERQTTHLIAIDAFAIALHALYVLLARHNLLPNAAAPQSYSNDRLRYELRMKPFIPISLPELVPYDAYHQEAVLEGDSDATVIERATKAVAEARKAWETTLANGVFLPSSQRTASKAPAIETDWARDIKDTMRACIGTSITIQTVKKALSATESMTQNTSAKPSGSAKESVRLQVEIPEVGSKARWHDWWVVPQISEKKPVST